MENVGKLPLGFRFRPTDIELINHYLRLKNDGNCNEIEDYITEVDLCKYEPWDLPDLSAIKTNNDNEWFFFCPIDRKHHNAQMLKSSNRATRAGYWKATGKDRSIKSKTMGLLGMKKTLVFYRGRAPKGQRTNWIIHEYRPDPVIQKDRANQTQAFVLCRLFKKDNDLKQNENDECRNTSETTKLVSSPNQNNFSGPAVDDGEDNQVVETGIKDGTKLQIIKPNGFEFPHDGAKTSHDTHIDCDDSDDIFSDKDLDRFFNPLDDVAWLSNFKEAFVRCQNDNDLKQSENDDCCNISEMTSLVSSPNQNHFLEPAVDDGLDIDQFLDDLDSESGTRDPPVLSETNFCENGDLVVNASEYNEHGTFNVIDEEATEFQYDGGITSHCNEPEFGEQHLPIETQIDDDIFSDQALDRFCNSPDVDDMTWLPSFGAALWQVHSNLSSDNEGTVTTESSLSDDFEESGVEDNEGTVTIESSLSDDFEESGVVDTGHSTNPLDLDKLCRTPLEAEEEVSRESDADISNQQPRKSISVSSKDFRCVLLVFMIAFLFIACMGLRKAQIAFLF